MSVGKVTCAHQPENFSFTDENKAEIETIIKKYPPGRQASAVLPLLQMAQKQHDNWLPRAAMDKVAEILEMPRVKVYEVATFYSMFNLKPVGDHHIQLCTTSPCCLSGALDLVKTCKDKLGIESGQTTEDGKFTLTEVECLGACVNAPAAQINDDYFEDLTPENFDRLLDDLAEGKKVQVGSQAGRKGSMAQAGPTSLKTEAEAAGVKLRNPDKS